MLKFSKLKITIIGLIVAFGFVFSSPNLMGDRADELPSWLQPVNLGLDLRGGSYLLLEVETAAVITEILTTFEEDVRATLRQNRIAYRDIRSLGTEDAVSVAIVDPEQQSQALNLLRQSVTDADVEAVDGGRVLLRLKPEVRRVRLVAAVQQSIEIVRRRIDEFGTTEPSIQQQGADRIIVELPGIDNPERVKALIGQTAKLNFHMIEESIGEGMGLNPRDMPPGVIVVPSAEQQGLQYAVKRRIEVSGDRLVDSQPTFQEGAAVVSFRFDTAGGRRFGQVTSNNVGTRLAIILDGAVISAPRIQSPILGGNGIITGQFTTETANDLALLLRAGALPAPLTVLEERTVGPGLGQDSIRAGEFASVLGLILVVVLIAVFYGLFGIFATIALTTNLALLLGVLSAIGATLTLPGIAGIVLTVGMAVDANVLIFERMREEVRQGRTLLNALDTGFRQAFKTILDSNLTTLIAAGLLFMFGTGPVRGFAVTLGVGVMTSMFSAIMVTRLMTVFWLKAGKRDSLPIEEAQS